ncbi:MAG: DUF2283 domain-containing protein [Candidatus Auribacter fodinae]|uniref:DUF2283 domain-containing protein n=1 Tax=Candidatus Auribacter fodinae TaxID=2093366 RepID=A0A3A4QRX9_9BACT|nr:MAG: DUF2283 domain-containing protein [Candidatus Auribacter fodinae]
MKLHIHYDKEGDFLEVRFGKPTASYYQEAGDDVFKRYDEKTGKLKGYAIHNFLKRKRKEDVDVEIPLLSE